MVEEGYEVVIYKASTIGQAPLLLSSLPRSDEYYHARANEARNEPRQEERHRHPQHQDRERKGAGRYVLMLLLFIIVVSFGLIIALVILRTKANESVGGRDTVSSSGVSSDYTTRGPTPTPQSPTIRAPSSPSTPTPNLPPNPLTVAAGSPRPTILVPEPTDGDHSVVLQSGASMSRNEAVYSPNGLYSFVMNENGDLILFGGDDEVLWRADGEGAEKCYMQSDGNLLLRKADRSSTWKSHTNGNYGAYLILDRGGQLAIISDDKDSTMPLWITGVPKGKGFSKVASISFPVRGAFYFPWFPETWTVNGSPTIYTPTLGKYSLEASTVYKAHLDALEYAHIDVAIASWFGPGTHSDRARLTNLLNESRGTSVKWTVYHEMERRGDPSVTELRDDLRYLQKWFAWHRNWVHIDGKPVIFVYNQGDCGVSERWIEAANDEWYVVLKHFRDDDKCVIQPNHWHEYGPATAVVHKKDCSYSISPGFWRAGQEVPALPRGNSAGDEWRNNVQNMVDSNEPWQLITTFNEWGDGTAVESGVEWESKSGFGQYLDVLHDIS
eukprot:CAMPEP_0119032184 /NCGR_PEP_ID=MMETSP1176-20130426/41921_1 /TAXON_ID=265551 /ORGANISM="Synedropsis recta cf, Strain CCMP1620" /LENGTH=553 /DNA_ID=CAMNT_0006988595 /DNA_START=200 /DNA_END=1861 /DNA_ORIENTATION=+